MFHRFNNKKMPVILGIIGIGILILFLYGAQLKAMILMTIWDQKQYENSILEDSGLSISIPGGGTTQKKDWFPFVMNFNADEAFSAYMNDPDLRLTVLYNFPAFTIKEGCSKLYDPESPYYNSFYGAYLLQNGSDNSKSAPFGFQYDNKGDLHIKPNEISIVPAFDYKVLVLHDFGLAYDDFVFDWKITDSTENVSYLGYDGWTAVSADLTVSGAVHKKQEGVFSYIQYGAPADYAYQDFTPAHMTGQIYARYFPETDVSVFFYIVGSDPEIVKDCDRQILSHSKITFQE